MKAMILTAGKGTRLLPLTQERAKPAVPIMGKPLIAIILNKLKTMGISQFRLNLHTLPESIIEAIRAFPEIASNVSYSYEPTILGTGGGLCQNKSFFSEDTFVMVNGDIIFDFDIRPVIDFHIDNGALATLALFPQSSPFSYTPIRFDSHNVIHSFPRFKDHASSGEAAYVFTGITVLSPDIFGFIRTGVFSDIVSEAYEPAIEKGLKICGYPVNGYWNDIGVPSRYLSAQRDLFVRWGIASSHIFSRGASVMEPELIGPNVSIETGCVIEVGCEIKDAILWENCHVRKGSIISHCVLGQNVVAAGHLENLVVTTYGEAPID
ncbi:MAG: NDP-sugar synthase [Pseudomonadota bacterium]